MTAGGPLLEGEPALEASERDVVAALEGVLAAGEPGAVERSEYALTALIKLSSRFPGQADHIQARAADALTPNLLPVYMMNGFHFGFQ